LDLGVFQPNFTVREGVGDGTHRVPGRPGRNLFLALAERRLGQSQKKELFLEGRSPSKPPSTVKQKP